jgi:hypothetical protein
MGILGQALSGGAVDQIADQHDVVRLGAGLLGGLLGGCNL